ncbi:protocadherin alpha-5-like isoform X2 [Phyllobates terribilis]|uniref:protocadherin alpha-5-like isoform X2 n=1 Tax=Phyllobates terribilis TaxID=111132 RepID=UPI003CCB3F7B
MEISSFSWFGCAVPSFRGAFVLQIVLDLVCCQLHYLIPEESKHGTFVGRIAQDLGLEIWEINSRMLRIVSRDEKDYFQVNLQNGILFVNTIIDREEICQKILVCVLHLEIIVDKPVQIYHVDVEIEDINDNYPMFSAKQYNIALPESRVVGTRFPLEGAVDDDIGINSVKTYELSPNVYFSLEIQKDKHQSESLDVVLKKSLDREKEPLFNLTLTAFDGGKPKLSGTTQLVISIQDVNDNAPTFSQSVYETYLLENAQKGTVVVELNATDADLGENGEVVYEFSNQVPPLIKLLFDLNEISGEIKVAGEVDFEQNSHYDIRIDAFDRGQYPMAGHCKVLVNVIDVNDNPPEMTVTSLSLPVPEDSPVGTTVAIIRIQDKDSGSNGKVNCQITENVPFKLKLSLREYYSLVVNGPLDREAINMYKIEITANDEGVPTLSTSETLLVEISDVNDNAPTFNQHSDTIFIMENNPPGSHVYTVSATDGDEDQNSFITYSLIESIIDGIPIISYLSINPENGKLFALVSFDQEQVSYFQCKVRATDAGFPPLSGNLTLSIFIIDINDNAPSLYTTSLNFDSEAAEIVPRSAKIGTVVSKVRATDADSGYNAWLSYEFKDPAERIPFGIGRHSGDISVVRPLLEVNQDEYKLIIVIKDHGEPGMSITVTMTFVLTEKMQEISAEQNLKGLKNEDFTNANTYLIIAICLISGIFLVTLVIYTFIRWQQCTQEIDDLRTNNMGSIARSWTYSMQRQYKYCMNGISPKNDLIFFTPSLTQALDTDRNPHQPGFMTGLSAKPKHPNPDWRYSASLKAAMQGAVHMEGAAVLRGAPVGLEQQWPTVSSATAEPEGGEVSPPVGAGVNCNSWTFKYGPGNQKQPVPQIPPDFPENFIIPGSPAIISIRQDQPSAQGHKSNFITFGKKEETKKKKKKKKGNKNQEKGNNPTDNNDQ